MFEGLLPEPHNNIVLDLLFTLALWHAYAKLRMHTGHTLEDFDKTTTTLGTDLRRFANKTCGDFETKELPSEHAARGRRKAAAAAKKGQTAPNSSGARIKRFNLRTYKLHSLGDYPQMIRRFGTTDSYSTQIVSLHSPSTTRYAYLNDSAG